MSLLLNHRYSHILMSVVWYLFYLSSTLMAFEETRIPVIPNVLITSVYLLFTAIHLLIASQEQDDIYSLRKLLIFMILAANPALLLAYFLISWIRQQRKGDFSNLDLIGPAVLALVLLLLVIPIYVTITYFFLFDPIPYHPWYILSILSIWSMIPLLATRLRIDRPGLGERLQSIVLNMRYRNVIMVSSITILLLFMIFTNPSSLLPVSVDR